MKKNRSFGTRLSLNILLITSVLFIIAILVAAISSHRLIANEATKSAENLLDATIANIESTLQSVEVTVRGASWVVEEHLQEKDYMYHITTRTVVEHEYIIGSAIAFVPNYYEGQYYFSPYSYLDGDRVLSKQLGNQKYDYFYMDWFQIPYLLGKPCWSEPYFDEGGAENLISTYSYPLKDENGKVYAIFTADVSLEWMNSILAGIKPYPNSFVSLVSRNGSYINVNRNSNLKGETIWSTLEYNQEKHSDLRKIARAMMSGERGMMRYMVGSNVSFAVFGPMSNGWVVSMTCDYKDVLRRTSQMHIVLILIGLLGLAVLFAVCLYTVRRMTKPLADFSQSAMSIAGGNFNTELPEIKSEDEIRTLRDSFDHMQHSITEYIENLKTTTAANERFESELNIASKIQMALLPRNFPDNGRVGVSAFLEPAREVGGDFYDFSLSRDSLNFNIGDVSGKGVPAALFMAITKAFMHFISGLGLSLDKVVGNTNDTISEGNDNGLFVTAFSGKLDLATGRLLYCNAGHNPLVVVPPSGEGAPFFLGAKPNIAIGVFYGFKYEMQSLELKKGSRLILYTDGITEAEKADKSQFGEQRLLDWAQSAQARGLDADAMCSDLLSEVRRFTDGNEQNDDITVMIINYK